MIIIIYSGGSQYVQTALAILASLALTATLEVGYAVYISQEYSNSYSSPAGY